MTLVRKSAVVVALFAVVNLAIGFALKRYWIDPAFEGFEQRSAEKDMKQVVEALQREADHLDDVALDYASWDATYEYVVYRDPKFLAENLSLHALSDWTVEWLALIDKSGQVISGPIYNLSTQELIDDPNIPQKRWDPSHPLLAGDTQKTPIAGLMITRAGPLVVASRDVLTSKSQGPSRGRIVVGRALNNEFLRGLERRMGLELRLWHATDPALPESIIDSLQRNGSGTLVSRIDYETNLLDAYILLDDIEGKSAIVLSTNFPREMTQSANYIASLGVLWIIVQGGILVFIILVPLNRAIIAPLGVLSRQIRAFRKTSDLTVSLDTHREGEIGEISREFGNMLRQLDEQIRERQKGEEALRQSEQHLRAAQEVARMGSWKLELTDGSWWWSDELYRIHGRDRSAGPLEGDELRESIYLADRERIANELISLIRGESVSRGTELRVFSTSGELRYYSILWSVERTADGNAFRVLGTASDVTEKHLSEEQLRRAAAVFDTATESIVIATPAGIIQDVNSAFSATTGYNRSEVVGRSANILGADRHGVDFFGSIIAEVAQIGKWEGEIWIRHRDGKPIPAWVSVGCTLADQKDIEQVVVVFNDMTERKHSEEVIAHQANYDMLTKLPNRYLFRDRLRRALLRAKRNAGSVGLLFFDLDGFKKINDTLGHAAGDETLRHAAERIGQSLREVDTAARLGGDEFAVIVPEIEAALDLEKVAQRIIDAIAAPMEIHGQDVVFTVSVGISVYPTDAEDDEELLRNADIAMYRSKKRGGNTLEFFTAEMNESVTRRLRVEAQLRKALERHEFEVYYQPVVSLPDAQLVAVEALLRWENAELGSVSPAEFIPIAERSGLIVPIGAWVLETACRQVNEWHDAEWPNLRVAVNLSPREVDRGDAVKSIQDALAKSGLPAEFLEIEVTERVLMDDVDRIVGIFEKIKGLGVRLCIDDFGTGYSSLSYLQNYPFDVLKIDRAFVSGAIGHEDGVSLLRAINSMAESLHLEVVAEGVETREQKDLLIELGCGYAQGFYFCHPMSADRLGVGGPVVTPGSNSSDSN